MKYSKPTLLIGLLFIAMVFSLHAQEAPRGFYGGVQLGAGYLYGTDSQETPATKFFADDPLNPRIDTLSGASQTIETPLPYLNGTIGYRFEELELMIQTSPETFLGSPGILMSKGIGKYGMVSGSVNYASARVYRNPYQTGVDRDGTDMVSWKLGAGWNNIMCLPISLNYSFRSVDVKQDRAGDLYDDLKRDGNDHGVELSGMVPLHQSVILLPTFGYTLRNREGAAESGNRYSAEGSLMVIFGSFQSMSGVGYGVTRFDEDHPVFSKAREDKELNLMQMFTYQGLLGVEELSLFVMAAYACNDSNIDFYDTEQLIVGSGLGYSF